MTQAEFFSSKYLFDPTPTNQSNLYWYLIGFFGFLILVSVAIYFIKTWDLAIRMKQFYCFLTIGILGFIYLFARYESLPWLASRFFLVLILVSLFGWIIGILIWMMKYNKKLESKKIMAERYDKYLPKAKKNK